MIDVFCIGCKRFYSESVADDIVTFVTAHGRFSSVVLMEGL